MKRKTDLLRKLAADIHEEIGKSEPIADDQLERNIRRAQALLRCLSEERDLRAAKQSPSSERLTGRESRRFTPPAVTRPGDELADALPKRDAIVTALEKIGSASPPARVAAVVRALFSVAISTSQFASFRKADERSYRHKSRNRVYIVPALAAADLTGMAGTVALSSWPLGRRIIGGYSQRADTLHAIVKAYLVYHDTHDEASAAIMRLVARELPSIAQHAPDLDAMGKAAEADLREIEARDVAEREAAAEKAARLDPATQLFGRIPLAVVGD